MKPHLTELIQQRFTADPERGLLIARIGPKAGKPVGALAKRRKSSYLKVQIGGHDFYVHRLVYFLSTGRWARMLDHHDRDGLNNRLSNLIPIDGPRENSWNTGPSIANKSGVPGISWDKRIRRWVVRVKRVIGKSYRGCFVHFADAVALRVQIEQQERGGFRFGPLVTPEVQAKIDAEKAQSA